MAHGQFGSGQLGDRTGHFNAGGTSPDHHEAQQAAALIRILGYLRILKSRQDAMADGDGIFGSFQDGSEWSPVIVAEIRMAGAGGQHQKVIGDLLIRITQVNFTRLTIDRFDTTELNLRVGLMAQNLSDRHGDLGER